MAVCEDRELRAWGSRSLIGCLHDYQRNTDAVCALIVQDDAAILAKVSTNANLDVETLGACSSMIFAASQMLARELGTEGEVLGRMTIGTEYHLLIMGITPKLALVTLCRKSFAKGLMECQARAMIPRMIDCLIHLIPEDR